MNHKIEIEKPRVKIPRVPLQIPRDVDQGVIVVNRNQNANEVIQQVRHHNYGTNINLTAMIERIMIHNGMNIGFHRTNFTSPLS